MNNPEKPAIPDSERGVIRVENLDIETLDKMCAFAHHAIEELQKELGVLEQNRSLEPIPETLLSLSNETEGYFGTHNLKTNTVELRSNLSKEQALMTVVHEVIHYYATNHFSVTETAESENDKAAGTLKTGFLVRTVREDNIGDEHLRSLNEAIVQATTLRALELAQDKIKREFPDLNYEAMMNIGGGRYKIDLEIFSLIVNKIAEHRNETTEELAQITEQSVTKDLMATQFTSNTLPLIREIEASCGPGALRVIGGGRSWGTTRNNESAQTNQVKLIKEYLETTDEGMKDNLAEKILGPFEFYQYLLHVHVRGLRQSLKNGSAKSWSSSELLDARHYVEETLAAAKKAFKNKFDQAAAELLNNDETNRTKREFLLQSAGYSSNTPLERIASSNPPASREQQIQFLSELMLEQQIESLRETQVAINNLL